VKRYSQAMFAPSNRSLTRESSSRNVTSRVQWHAFSMDLSYCPPSRKLCDGGIESHRLDPLRFGRTRSVATRPWRSQSGQPLLMIPESGAFFQCP
jgi:hypothetical protein